MCGRSGFVPVSALTLAGGTITPAHDTLFTSEAWAVQQGLLELGEHQAHEMAETAAD